MTAQISCKCGWFVESMNVSELLDAELVASRHEDQDIRRPYRHDTMVEEIAA
jgi:hypothetical protein